MNGSSPFMRRGATLCTLSDDRHGVTLTTQRGPHEGFNATDKTDARAFV